MAMFDKVTTRWIIVVHPGDYPFGNMKSIVQCTLKYLNYHILASLQLFSEKPGLMMNLPELAICLAAARLYRRLRRQNSCRTG